MARELKALYEHLESEVEVRTAQIVESNRELERQRRELESMNRILQQDNLLKEDFLAKMSHEIRTPLTSILAFVDLWEQTNTPRDEGEGKIMSEMKLSSQILLSMVNNILDLTRVEAGRAEVVLGPVDVADLLGMARDGVTFLAEKKRATVSVSVGKDVPVVLSDAEKLRRIVENLVSNAVKFVDAGGRVRLEGSYDFAARELLLAVSDDGCGIAPEDLPHVFDRFARGNPPAGVVDRCYGSSGLGLALVKNLVELLGGGVSVESRVGEGSVFTVTVPAEPLDLLADGDEER